MTQQINKEAEVNAFYFGGNKNLKSFPEQITVDGQRYTFLKSGIGMVIHKGQGAIRVFTMSDGHRRYQIRQEQNTWMLTTITSSVEEVWV